MAAADEIDLRVELLPLPKRALRWAPSIVESLLTEGPAPAGDSQLVVVRRSDGERLGAIPIGASDGGLLDQVRADAEELDLDAFCAEWGLTTR